MKRQTFITLLCALAANALPATEPNGYYDSCEGKTGKDLLQALASKISNHTNVGYDGLWAVYIDSDTRADGTLWDIYTTKHWPSNFSKCGNYKLIGDCVNREHSFPKSWWGGGKSAQYSDAFHLYPTDGKVNGQRSNFPYGECTGGTRLPDNGTVQALGRLGTCTYPGYTGKVFEPDDEYKGDLARSYFYMAAAYNGNIGSWSSDMLAGNNYPVYKSWAVNMLLKWARNDEVSQKELDRNEAVYKHQKNRNPFIDHPELVEYIWGDKVGTPWTSNAVATPTLTHPAVGTQLALGNVAVGVPRTATLTVKGSNMDNDVYLRTSGAGWSVNTSKLTAAEANAGATVTLQLTAAAAGGCSGTLTLTCGEIVRSVALAATAVSGLPFSSGNVSPSGITLRWVNLHSSDASAQYTLTISADGEIVSGYPKSLPAKNETYTANDLEPSTIYICTLEAPGLEPAQLKIRTSDPIPYIGVLYDGELHFDAQPGVPSACAELLLDVENITEDMRIEVKKPFEVSTDKGDWAQYIFLTPQEERFYMRVYSATEGEFDTDIVITSDDYFNDNAEATASVIDATQQTEWLEDFEFEAKDLGQYDAKTFTTHMATWSTNDGGFWPDSDRSQCGGTTAFRAGKSATSTLTMTSAKNLGMGMLSFDFRPFGTDGNTVLEVEYCAEGSNDWQSVGTLSYADPQMKTFSMNVAQTGSGRIRFRQTEGKRWFIDNIAIANYSAQDAVHALEYHSWDAYARGGSIIIDTEKDADVAIYDIQGHLLLERTLNAGVHTLEMPSGVYFVYSNGFTRRVMLR